VSREEEAPRTDGLIAPTLTRPRVVGFDDWSVLIGALLPSSPPIGSSSSSSLSTIYIERESIYIYEENDPYHTVSALINAARGACGWRDVTKRGAKLEGRVGSSFDTPACLRANTRSAIRGHMLL
jgi:hypothetical protein